jgi:exopolyphosphatase/guanosine-5'-triphosphate,3'-diphosphate pyrophosphatase
MSELFEAKDEVPNKQLRLMRDFAREVIEESIPKAPRGLPKGTLGSSGTIGAIVSFARNQSLGHATRKQITKAVEELADMSGEKRRKRFDPRRADIVVAGAVILEAILEHFDQDTITPVDRGLREGVLQDLVRRRKHDAADRSLADAAVEVGRRFDFGEEHGKQVTRLALTLFDDLASLHQMPASARPWLEVAGLLHDIGQAVNYQRHHKHSQYLIQNADIAGLTDRERQIVGAMARFHRRSPPEAGHEAMQPFNSTEVRIIRKCATLLRVADSLDRGHHQPVRKIDAAVRGSTVNLRVKAASSIDLELWDVEHEAGLFKDVFGKSLMVQRSR